MNQGRNLFRAIVLTLGFAFLYGPIVSLIVYSFNASKLVTVWGGFSTKWYGELHFVEARHRVGRLFDEVVR